MKNWDEAIITEEPEYSCECINATQEIVKELPMAEDEKKDVLDMLEDVRKTNMKLRAYARTGWSRVEEAVVLREKGEGFYFDDIEEELEEEGYFQIT